MKLNFQEKKKRCIFLLIILFLLVAIPVIFFGKKQPEGEYIKVEEIRLLANLLLQVEERYEVSNHGADGRKGGEENISKGQSIGEWKQKLIRLNETISSWEESYFTYGQFREWEEICETGLDTKPGSGYRNSFFLLKDDWYSYFGELLKQVDPDGLVVIQELLVLGDHTNVKDIEAKPIEGNKVFTDNGLWENHLFFLNDLPNRQGKYITFEGGLWGRVEAWSEGLLSHVWLVDRREEELVYFYNNHEVTIPVIEEQTGIKEQVANLRFQEGMLTEVDVLTERISGEVLLLSESQVEIRGRGVFPLDENIQYYRLYDRLETVGRNAVRIGYAFCDFVVRDGKIKAALLVKDEQMENIRVLLKGSNFDGYYHQRIECVSDVDMEVKYGEESRIIPAGESLILEPGSTEFSHSRVFLTPMALTGRTHFSSIERNNQGQGYRGSFEIEKREEGLVIINQVLLEEYLYAVVPSEMPGYYPLEALKAQAICARTYAYDKMLNASLSSWGAHLDDSSTFQVYNNIQENSNTTRAVKETRGLLLYAPDGLAKTYYYSTSGGFGTNDAIWNQQGESVLSYLQAREMSLEPSGINPDELMQEEAFRNFIDNPMNNHFEVNEGWYRWSYSHINMDHILENLITRQENSPANIRFSSDGENYTDDPIPQDFKIRDIQVLKRGAGGTVEALLFVGDGCHVLVEKELNVRAVLTDGEAVVNLQDGKTYACQNLLPSAFFYIMVQADEGGVTSLALKGGGFGHGVGMSQNGAKNLANQGKTYETILTFYYNDCWIQQPQ